MKLTVKDVIQLFQGHSLRLAAGAGGIENVVHSVNIMDAPDIGRWSKPGDLILSTAFAVKDDVELQETLIRDMAASRCAALGIKTKRFLPEIPLAMRKIADECNLPILELPFNMSLAEIMNSVMSSIAARQSYLLQRSNEIHKALTTVAIGSGGLSAIIECLGKLIQCPVGCYDTNGHALVSWVPKTMPGLESDIQAQIKQYLNSSQAHSHELQKQLSKTKTPFTQPVRINDTTFFLTSFAIMSSNEFFGHLSILQISDTFLDINCLALEHTCTVAALDFLKQKAVAESRRLHSRDMLERILFEDLANQNTNDLIASSLIGQAKFFRCAIVEIDGTHEEMNFPVISTRLYKITQQAVTAPFPLSLVSERAGKIIALIASSTPFGSFEADLYPKIQKAFYEKDPHFHVSVGLGPVVSDISKIRQSYHNAVQSIELGRKTKGDGHITYPHEIASYSLLAHADAASLVLQVCANTITRLEQADKTLGMDLIKTLEKYLECDKNITETAKELYIHRNTLSNRLERIAELGEVDFGNREFLFCLRLTLRSRRIR